MGASRDIIIKNAIEKGLISEEKISYIIGLEEVRDKIVENTQAAIGQMSLKTGSLSLEGVRNSVCYAFAKGIESVILWAAGSGVITNMAINVKDIIGFRVGTGLNGANLELINKTLDISMYIFDQYQRWIFENEKLIDNKTLLIDVETKEAVSTFFDIAVGFSIDKNLHISKTRIRLPGQVVYANPEPFKDWVRVSEHNGVSVDITDDIVNIGKVLRITYNGNCVMDVPINTKDVAVICKKANINKYSWENNNKTFMYARNNGEVTLRAVNKFANDSAVISLTTDEAGRLFL